MKLQLYVLKIVGTRILGAAAILLAVLQILDLLEVTTDILDRGLGMGGVIYYAALRFPRLIEQVAPISVLAGGLFAFSQLARENAVIAMRASGVSAYRIVGMAAPAAILVVLIHLGAAQVVAPRTDPMLATWWDATTPAADRKAPQPRAFRVGGDLVTAETASPSGERLNAVKIYRRAADGRLSQLVEASSATHTAAGWRLEAPKTARFTVDKAELSSASQMIWPLQLRAADVQALFADNQPPSAASARRALAKGGTERPESYYATKLQAAFAGPIAALVMLLLSAPVALANFRSSQGAVLLTGGLAAGLIFLVAQGLLSALGEGGVLSPALAVWSAPAVFAALAATMLLKLEG
ncbi:MAG: permease [Caulobacter sp.]|nr:permease [Caulobacter sp.]